jgi:hypothetical protein
LLACRGAERVPLAIIANLTGLSRMSLCQARDSGRVSADTAEVLTPIVRETSRPAQVLAHQPTQPLPNLWEVVET